MATVTCKVLFTPFRAKEVMRLRVYKSRQETRIEKDSGLTSMFHCCLASGRRKTHHAYISSANLKRYTRMLFVPKLPPDQAVPATNTKNRAITNAWRGLTFFEGAFNGE